MIKVLGIAGSLRQGSYNRALLRAAKELCPPALALDIFPLDQVPLYNGDLDQGEGPDAVAALRQAVGAARGLLIATPEYNYGIPGVLKNALDWASRPANAAAIVGKPVAILGASPSRVGTARAQGQLKQVLAALKMPLFPAAEFVLGEAHRAFDSEGRLTDAATRELLQSSLGLFASWLERQEHREAL